MIQLILTHIIPTLQAILLMVVVVVFIVALIANRLILRRMRRHIQRSEYTSQVIRQALENSRNNVLLWNIKEKYSTQMYGKLLPGNTISDADWKRHVHPDDLDEALRCLHDLMNGKVKVADFYYHWNY